MNQQEKADLVLEGLILPQIVVKVWKFGDNMTRRQFVRLYGMWNGQEYGLETEYFPEPDFDFILTHLRQAFERSMRELGCHRFHYEEVA